MADEMKKVEETIRRYRKQIENSANDWLKYVDGESDKVADYVRRNTKEISDTFAKERKKIELRSEIGEHNRALTKAYTRLGEAYYESLKNNRSLDDMKDVIALIDSNKRLIGLLNDQLKAMEGSENK
jgi:cell shape-determining protein MreC